MSKYNTLTEPEYRKVDALSYSFLKELTHGPKIILEGMQEKSSRGLSFCR
jgi:hypothetical protein